MEETIHLPSGAQMAASEPRAGLFRRWQLLVPAVLAPVVETTLLLQLGPKDGAALGPQVSAPPPFDLFHDLRWIAVYHNSWLTLALELLGMLVLRSLYVAFMVQMAWPKDRAAPSMLRAFPRALAFHVVAGVLLLPWVVLLFGMALMHVSYLFFAALPPTLVIAVLIHRGALNQTAGGWWRWGPTWVSVGWLVVGFLGLTLAGTLVSVAPLPVALLMAAAAGLLNAKVIFEIVSRIAEAPAPARARVRRWANRLVPVAVVAMFGVATGGTSVGFAVNARSSKPAGSAVPIPVRGDGHPVLAASGYNSHWSPGQRFQLPKDFVGYQFSYLGLDARGRLAPYGPRDTLQPLDVSARRMGQEVAALHRGYRSPVTIVADSEGALVARTFILRIYRPSSGMVDRLIVMDLPVGLSSVYYPPRGREGWGVGTGWGLRGLAALIRNIAPIPASADAPFVRDLVQCKALIASLGTSPPPAGVDEVSFRALADSVDGVYPLAPAGAEFVFSAVHGTLIDEPGVDVVIEDILTGVPTRHPGVGVRLAHVVAALAGPWHVPSLVPDLAPVGGC